MTLLLLLGCTGAGEAGDAPDYFPTRIVTRAGPLDPPRASEDPVQSETVAVRAGPAAVFDQGEGWEARWLGQVTASRCAALEDRVSGPGGERYLDALAYCGDPRHAERFTRPETPPHVLVHWAESLRDRGERVPPEALEAAARVAADPDRWDGLIALLRGVCETDRPDLAPALNALLDAASGPALPALAASCPHQSDARLARAWQDACAGGACVVHPDVLEDPDSAVRSSIWLPGLFARYPQHAKTFEQALARCARDPLAARAPFCLEALAERDWAVAVEVSATRAPSAEPAMAEVQGTLARFDSHDALLAYLTDLGALPADSETRLTWREPEASPLTVLFNRDLVPSTDAYLPYALPRVAARVPGLENAITQVVPPPEDTEDGRWTLRLWVGTTRYQALVPAYEGELETVATFLNAVLGAEGLPTRLGRPDAEPMDLVIAPAEALTTLNDAGLLRLQDHRDRP